MEVTLIGGGVMVFDKETIISNLAIDIYDEPTLVLHDGHSLRRISKLGETPMAGSVESITRAVNQIFGTDIQLRTMVVH